MTEQWHHGTYAERTHALVVRGMDLRLADELRWAGNPALIIEAERATDAEIAALNAEYVKRNPH
jgi:hypothetical protein